MYEQKSTDTAYALSIASFFIGGIHRFYLGKIGTGILYLLTWNLCGIGLLYDWLTMKDQVRQVNAINSLEAGYAPVQRPLVQGQNQTTGDNAERIALRLARNNRGFTTPAQLALDGNMSVETAKAELDSLANRGIADIRIRHNGVIAYVFPDFLDPELEREFEIL